MFIKTMRVRDEAYFDVSATGWMNHMATTRDIYRPADIDDILLNADHIAAAYPVTYKSGMDQNTPPSNAQDKWLCEAKGTKVILVTGASFTVTAKLHELEAAIGTGHAIDVA